MHDRRSSRDAFTLLEVILALALSALLLGALAMAIQTSLKATYSGRSDVSEAQLARAALERIGNDLRAAVWIEQPDPASMVAPPAVASLSSSSSPGGSGGAPGSPQGTSTVTNVSSSSNSSSSRGGGGSSGGGSGGGGSSGGGSGGGSRGGGGSGGSGSSGGGSAGGSGGGGSSGGGSSSGGTAASSSSSTTPMQMPMPMFVGGQSWLQVDVSHLPRPDQYAFLQNPAGGGAAGGSMASNNSATGASSANGATTMRDRISEMKTVYYFLAGPGGGASQMPPGLSAGMTGNQQGLMRREADRAVTAWTAYGGGSAGIGPALEALAPEIETLNFRYFNGSAWSATWDSRSNYCLPRAVEIRITLANKATVDNLAARPAARSAKQAPPKEYVLTVPIPAWRPPNLQLLNTLANQAASGSGASGSSTSTGMGGAGSF